MSDQDLSDLCRRIAAEHSERLVGAHADAPDGVDPLAVVSRLDAYAEALQDLSARVLREVSRESPR